MIFTKHRFEVWGPTQHPYRHDVSEFAYSNPALPGVTNLEGALNWLTTVLYPNTKESVALKTDLPTTGNTLNDYRVVRDDGDGKAAGYRWEQREGDTAAKWYKVYDMDWGETSILSNFLTKTQDVYVFRYGLDDTDSTGAVVTGTFAGQTIHGGQSANTNLTLRANAGDGTGPHTGYVQVDDHFRPTVDATYSLGTATGRFLNGYFSGSLAVSTMALASGSITDSSGAISFGDENLSTTGNITGATVKGTTSLVAGTTNTVTIQPGSITDSTSAINFGASSLTTTGSITSLAYTSKNGLNTLKIAAGASVEDTITSSLGQINFGAAKLITTGTLSAGATTLTQLNVDNIQLDANTISITNLNGGLNINANGTGVIAVGSAMTTGNITTTGAVSITGSLVVDSLTLDGTSISSSGAIALAPTGNITVAGSINPTTDNARGLGTSLLRYTSLFLSTSLGDGTNTFTMADIMKLRSTNFRDTARTIAAQTGDSLFYDATNGVWLASAPDSEIDHGQISGLLDDDHTQYALLAGRAGGQVMVGGSGISESLTLASTSNATKGNVLLRDPLAPETTASYTTSWAGTDLGTSALNFRHVYTKGEHFGFRFENVTALPAAAASAAGRMVYHTTEKKAYVDTGASFIALSVSRLVLDTSWDGTQTSQTFTTTGLTDARNAIFQLLDNTNNFETIYCTIQRPTATSVTVTVSPALPAGTYRLIGLE